MARSRAARRVAAAGFLRLGAVLLAAGVIAPLAGAALPAAALAARASHVKVAIIVGPVGGLTDYYRGMAEAAAAVARRHTDRVVTVYSPDATWPAVRRALDGSSIAIYLGHGNGWPSRYSRTLNPRTQDGLGLNPVAGAGDDAHQYFGEQYLARSVRFAPGAVVLLHHLCYASGAAEPGMAQPPVDVAVQRVDNFGAGWLAAGASAVVAEAHGAPAHYVEAFFRGRGTVEGIWRAHPSFNDHVLASASVRTAGGRVLLDPDRRTTDFYRSLVIRPGLRVAHVLGGRLPDVDRTTEPSPEPSPRVSLAALGAAPMRVRLAGPVVADVPVALTLAIDGTTAELVPDGLTIGTRWDLLVPAPDPTIAGQPAAAPPAAPSASADPPAGAPSPSPTIAPGSTPDAPADLAAGASPSPGLVPAPSPSPPADGAARLDPFAATPVAGPSPASGSAAPGSPVQPAAPPGVALDPLVAAPASAAADPPKIALVRAEVPGTLVTATPAEGTGRRRGVTTTAPARPGLYLLVTTLHDADGVAYDAASQELVPSLVVQVTGRIWASYATPSVIAAVAGETVVVRVRLANSGSEPWGGRPVEDLVDVAPLRDASRPLLVARWSALGSVATTDAGVPDVAMVPAHVEPGSSAVLELALRAPATGGEYLLVLDVTLPDGRSLAAMGVPPGLVRVAVAAPPAPVPGDEEPPDRLVP